MDQEEKRLLAVLNESHSWPTVFLFKFIVPTEQASALEALFPEYVKREVRPSSGGRYSAYTIHCAVASAEEVLAHYARVKGIPGLLSF